MCQSGGWGKSGVFAGNFCDRRFGKLKLDAAHTLHTFVLYKLFRGVLSKITKSSDVSKITFSFIPGTEAFDVGESEVRPEVQASAASNYLYKC